MLADLEEGNVSVGVVSAEVGKMLGVLRLSSSEGMSLATSEAARLSEPANGEKIEVYRRYLLSFDKKQRHFWSAWGT